MIERYVNFETAKLLEEKGFKIRCNAVYYTNNSNHTFDERGVDRLIVPHVNAPTQQMVIRWLRKEHKFYIDSFVTYKNDIPHYQWRIENLKTKDTIVETPSYDEPEEAIEFAILYCLKNLI